MARGRSGSRQTGGAMTVPSLTGDPLSALLSPVPQLLSEIEDGRLWHPDPDQGAKTVLGGWARIEPNSVSIGSRWARAIVHKRPVVARANTWWTPRGLPVGVQVPVGFKFESPFKVVTCLRRKIRREVIFAKKKAGFGARRRHHSRRSWRSNVSC